MSVAEQVAIVPVFRGLFGPTLPDGTQLDSIEAMATVSEHHHDEMEITDHPVATGSSIVDHAYKRPAEVTLHLGWSNSPNGNTNPIGDDINAVYAYLLSLQSGRALFELYTAKRVYPNMLIKGLTTETDFKSENALLIIVECRELILVDVSTVKVPAQTAASPEKNGSSVPAGNKNLSGIGSTTLSPGTVPPPLNAGHGATGTF